MVESSEQYKDKTIQKSETWEDCFEEIEEDYKEALIEKLEDSYSLYPTKIQNDMLFTFLEDLKNIQENTKQLYFIKAPGGSGKTLSFALPAVITVMENLKFQNKENVEFQEKSARGKKQQVYKYFPSVVILADTRTLIEQTKNEVNKCIPESYADKIHATALYAEADIDKFGQILITNPKTLADKIGATMNQILLSQTTLFICDEAELIQTQHAQEMEKIINTLKTNEKIFSIFTSATLTSEFEKAINKLYQYEEPQKLYIELNLEGVQQYQVELPPDSNESNEYQIVYGEVIKLLEQCYAKENIDTQVMIFVESVKQLENFYEIFMNEIKGHEYFGDIKNQFGCQFIHGKMAVYEQNGKFITDKKKSNQMIKEIYELFRDGKFQVLMCTDIMARGIDIDRVGLVINLFAPRQNSSVSSSVIDGPKYLHRIARTGRYVRKGVAITFQRSINSKFSLNDNLLGSVVNEIEGLYNNKIESMKLASDYVVEIAKNVRGAIEFNTDEKNKEEKK